MADKEDILLNSREVAFLLDLSPDTVNDLARRGIVPAFKKGRQWRFRKRDVTLFKRQSRGRLERCRGLERSGEPRGRFACRAGRVS
jgi:excisionase family DNA binding protein